MSDRAAPDELTDFDVLLLGAGQANVPLTGALLDAGRSVCLVEREHVGGSCVNFGCTPSKAAHAAGDLIARLRQAPELGVEVGQVRPDFPRAMARARAVAAASRDHLRDRFESFEKDNRPFRLVDGHGRLDGRDGDKFVCRVGELRLTAAKVVVDVGTRTLRPPIDGLDRIDPAKLFTAGNWVDKTRLPASMLMVGGGIIALEGGQLYRRMGADVCVIESGDRVAGKEDPDVAQALREILERDGVTFKTGCKVTAVADAGDKLRVTLGGEAGQETAEVEALYLSPGRRPNTDDCGLDTIGVDVGEKGMIDVDGHLRTGVENVWAAGDVAHELQFTNNANDDRYVLLPQLLGEGAGRSIEHRGVPYAIFTDPPLGRAGMTEQQARDAGRDVACVKIEAQSNGRHYQIGRTTGFVKLVGDRATGKLLGAACLLDGGDDMAHLFQLCLAAGGDLSLLTDTLFIHPTRSEAALSCAKELQKAMADG